MKDSTFLGLLESQLELIKASDGKEANSAILETAKLLLTHLDLTEETKLGYDKFDTRELFAALAAIGETAVDFFRGNKTMLDPAAQSGKLGTRLSDIATEISETAANLRAMQEQEAELLAAEQKLSAIKDEYLTLEQKAAELRAVRDTMTPEVLEALEQEISGLERAIQDSSQKRDQLNEKLARLRVEFAPIEEELKALEQEDTSFGASVIAYITAHEEKLRLIFEKRGLELERIKKQIEEYQALYARYEETANESAELLAMYEAQLGENGVIVEAMKQYGVKSLADALDDIDRIKNQIGADLKAYDLILKKVVEHEERVRQAIEQRQGKHF